MAVLVVAALAVVLVWAGGVAQGAESVARFLPANTVLFVTTPDYVRLDTQWQQTSYAALKKDKRIDAFLDEVRVNKQEDWLTPHDRFGTDTGDLKDIAAGEVAGAILPLGGDRYATVMLIDATGRQAQLQANMVNIDRHWASVGGKRSITARFGTPLIVFELPPKSQKRGVEHRIYFQLGNIAIDTDRLEVVDAIIQRFSGAAPDSLATHPPFVTVMSRATSLTDAAQPDARWYVDPLAMWKMIDGGVSVAQQPAAQRPAPTRPSTTRQASTTKTSTSKKSTAKPGIDWRSVFERQGGKGLRGVGGAVHFSVGQFDFLHRTTVLAPAPFEKGMQMFSFMPGTDYQPPPWVDALVTRYSTFYAPAKPLYDGFTHLFNDLNGEGDDQFLQEIMKSLKSDPEGPQVDIPNDVVGKLGPRLVAIRDDLGPPDAIGNPSRRVLLAAVANDPKKTFDTIERFYEGDPEFDRRQHNGHVYWAANKPGVSLFGSGDDPAMPAYNTLSVVPEGYLFVATDDALVREVLDKLSNSKQPLARAADFQFIASQLAQFATRQTFAQHFSRTDEEARETYELLRNGKLSDGGTRDAQLLNSFLFPGGRQAQSRRKIDGSKLPDFDELRKHFGPGGLTAELAADGWQFVGFVVRKSGPVTK